MTSRIESRAPRIEMGKANPKLWGRPLERAGAGFPEISEDFRFAVVVSTQAHTPPGLARRRARRTGNALPGAQWRSAAHSSARASAFEQTNPTLARRPAGESSGCGFPAIPQNSPSAVVVSVQGAESPG